MIDCLIHHHNGHRVEVWREPCLRNWDLWQDNDRPHRFFAGIHAYAQLVFAIEVKPNILETDPGPLDARVP